MSNHLEFAAAESAACEPDAFERWASKAETLLGHSLDGDESKDGYSLDSAYDAWESGLSFTDYASRVHWTAPRIAKYIRDNGGFGRIYSQPGGAIINGHTIDSVRLVDALMILVGDGFDVRCVPLQSKNASANRPRQIWSRRNDERGITS